jgi:hypothetical protein
MENGTTSADNPISISMPMSSLAAVAISGIFFQIGFGDPRYTSRLPSFLLSART